MSIKFKIILIVLDKEFFKSLEVAGRYYVQMKEELY